MAGKADSHWVVRGGRIVAMLALGGWLPACSPPTDSEKAYLEGVEARAERQDNLKKTLETAREDEDIVKLVKTHKAADGRGTYEDWGSRQMNVTHGTILFPRWQVARKGASKYEVSFTFSKLDAGGNMTKMGWAWSVDQVLKLISEPRALTTAELVTRGVSRLSRQRQRGDGRPALINLE